jgi:hypothetical protein
MNPPAPSFSPLHDYSSLFYFPYQLALSLPFSPEQSDFVVCGPLTPPEIAVGLYINP